MIVTIDGPAGTGKSTAARRLAERLGFDHLDTGAMYRVVAWRCLQTQIDLDSHDQIADTARNCSISFEENRVLVDSVDVTDEIRSAEVTSTASIVAQVPRVRDRLVGWQRELAEDRDIVCEGRDQGTVVFPNAECKFFLTADVGERARRRQRELEGRGEAVDFEDLLRQQIERDARDQDREVAPLRPATDAIVIDTTSLSIDQVVELLCHHVDSRRSTSTTNG